MRRRKQQSYLKSIRKTLRRRSSNRTNSRDSNSICKYRISRVGVEEEVEVKEDKIDRLLE